MRFNPRYTALLGFLFTLFLMGCVTERIADEHASDLGFVENRKVRAEGRIRLLKDTWEDAENKPDCYFEAREKYIDSQAAFNGWLVELKANLIAGQLPDSDSLDEKIGDALLESEAFFSVECGPPTPTPMPTPTSTSDSEATPSSNDLALQLQLDPNFSAGFMPVDIDVDAIVSALSDASMAIAQQYHDAENLKKVGIMELLNSLEWSSFEDI